MTPSKSKMIAANGMGSRHHPRRPRMVPGPLARPAEATGKDQLQPPKLRRRKEAHIDPHEIHLPAHALLETLGCRPVARAAAGRAEMEVRVRIFAIGAIVGPRLARDHDITRRIIGPEDSVRKAERAVAFGDFFGRAGEAHRHAATMAMRLPAHSTVTDFARLRGWSTSVPFATAT